MLLVVLLLLLLLLVESGLLHPLLVTPLKRRRMLPAIAGPIHVEAETVVCRPTL